MDVPLPLHVLHALALGVDPVELLDRDAGFRVAPEGQQARGPAKLDPHVVGLRPHPWLEQLEGLSRPAPRSGQGREVRLEPARRRGRRRERRQPVPGLGELTAVEAGEGRRHRGRRLRLVLDVGAGVQVPQESRLVPVDRVDHLVRLVVPLELHPRVEEAQARLEPHLGVVRLLVDDRLVEIPRGLGVLEIEVRGRRAQAGVGRHRHARLTQALVDGHRVPHPGPVAIRHEEIELRPPERGARRARSRLQLGDLSLQNGDRPIRAVVPVGRIGGRQPAPAQKERGLRLGQAVALRRAQGTRGLTGKLRGAERGAERLQDHASPGDGLAVAGLKLQHLGVVTERRRQLPRLGREIGPGEQSLEVRGLGAMRGHQDSPRVLQPPGVHVDQRAENIPPPLIREPRRASLEVPVSPIVLPQRPGAPGSCEQRVLRGRVGTDGVEDLEHLPVAARPLEDRREIGGDRDVPRIRDA